MSRIFHICTITNDAEKYRTLTSSLVQAGFDPERCSYARYDNAAGNAFDPYQVWNAIELHENQKYIIFCHQDIVLDQGDGLNELLSRLAELDARDPHWAICGNAGVNDKYEYVVRISDLVHSPNWTGAFPQRVHSLDENFLVVKASKKMQCSPGMRGFHFYGTDLCLHAIANGNSCYAIDFHVSHMSRGLFTASFWETKALFYRTWKSRSSFCYVRTMTGQVMCFSRNRVLRALGSMPLVSKFMLFINRLHPFLHPTTRKLNPATGQQPA